MERLKLRNLNSTYGREPMVHTDGIVYKEIPDPKVKGKVHNHIIAAKFFCGEKDLSYFKQSELIFEHRMSLTAPPELFKIPEASAFDEIKPKRAKAEKFKDLYCIDLFRKTEKIIRRDDEKSDNHPIIAINKVSYGYITQMVYNIVKDGVTTPMFPNFMEPQILAAQLKCNVPTARRVMDALRSGKKGSKTIAEKVERAKYLLEQLEKWKIYVFEEMKKHGLLAELKVAFNSSPFEAYEVLMDEEIIEDEIISRGVAKGHIKFSDSKPGLPATDFAGVMEQYAPEMMEIIFSIAKPWFRKGQIPQEIDDMLDAMPLKALKGQRDVIMAGLISLSMQRIVQVVGECGSGKTLTMLQMLYLHHNLQKETMKTVVLSPGHIVESGWTKEVKQDLPDAVPHMIRSVSDLLEYKKKGYLKDDVKRVFIISQETAKSGYKERPAVNWRILPIKDELSGKVTRKKYGFSCPNCGEVVTHKVKVEKVRPTDPGFVEEPVPFDHFSSKKDSNHKCKSCESVLWTPYVKSQMQEQYIYLPDPGKTGISGFHPRHIHPIKERLKALVYAQGAAKTPKERKSFDRKIDQYRLLENMINGKEKESMRPSPYKVPVAEFIAKKMKHEFTSVIIDEFHHFQGDSDRSKACSDLVKSVKYVVTGTGTAMNGYAKSIFRTLFMLFPDKMKKFGFTYKDEAKFQATFGVTEKKFLVTEEVNKKTKKKQEKLRLINSNDKPGISPIIFIYFLQDTTVFMSLDDLADDLPKLEHNVVSVPMSRELAEKKAQLENEIRILGRRDNRMVKTALQIAYGFLDSPTVTKEIRDRDTGDLLLQTPTISMYEDNKLMALEEYMQDRVRRRGRRAMVYTYYTSDGINEYLGNHLKNEGYKVAILNTPDRKSIGVDETEYRVKRETRQEWIDAQVDQGCDILITSATLVETGMNLQPFPSILYYQLGHNLYTNRQADRRAWRVGQKEDCEITYLYYEDSLQEMVASLMATKIIASQSIEGNLDESGLDHISNDRTIEEELAKLFYENNKKLLKGSSKK